MLPMQTSTRHSILETAIDVLVSDGVGALTLERVAQDAGLSKGGLLYHYEGKEQLLEALIDLLVQDLDRERVDQSAINASSQPKPPTLLPVNVAIESNDTQSVEPRSLRGHEIASILMGAQAINPQLLEPVRERYQQWQRVVLADGTDSTRTFVARLALEGLWFSEALGLAPPTRDQRMTLSQEIHELAQQGDSMREVSSIIEPAQPADIVEALSAVSASVEELKQRTIESTQMSAQTLLGKQNTEGFWHGDLTADTTLESDYVLLLLWLYPPVAGKWDDAIQAKIDKSMRTILDRQLPDGGWNIYSEGPAEVNATTRAYVALRVCGYEPDHPIMLRARERILALGGLQATNSYTKNNLSMFGLFPRKFTPSVPPELVLIPGNVLYEISSWSRAIVVPLSIIQASGVRRHVPGNWTVDELMVPKRKLMLPKKDPFSIMFHQADKMLKLWEKRGFKDIRAKAIREAEKWMLDHMRFTDGLGAIFPGMMYALMAMDALGYERDHPDFIETLSQLEGLIIEREESLQFQPSLSPVWDTAISIFALGELGAGDSDAMRHAADWLLSKEVRRKGDWSVKRPSLQPGGWPFQFANELYPDIDDTAMVLLALEHAKASDPERQARVENRAVNWLLGMQSSDGGWAAFDVDNDWEVLNKVPFADHNAMLDPSCPDITGRVLEALCRRGYDHQHQAIARAVKYLLGHQQADGSWYGRWGVNYTYGTFLAVRGLRASGSPTATAAIQRAATWVRAIQNQDGGWGESCASYEEHTYVAEASTPSQTAWALLALEAAGDRTSTSALRGIEWLLNRQNQEGGWDEELMTGTGFPNVFYLKYHLYSHYFPLLALGTWRRGLGAR
ncbi:MAG: squalene-hopene cyclase [Nitrospirales bacterium]|nr:MAG: squalene-hopene cyclase [Nitrospirales bacterium]